MLNVFNFCCEVRVMLVSFRSNIFILFRQKGCSDSLYFKSKVKRVIYYICYKVRLYTAVVVRSLAKTNLCCGYNTLTLHTVSPITQLQV